MDIVRIDNESRRPASDYFLKLLNSTSYGFCVVELVFGGNNRIDCVFKEVNPAFEKQTGLKELIGKSFYSLCPTGSQPWIGRIYDVIIRNKNIEFIEYFASSGKWFEISVAPFGEEGSNLAAALLSDITERKIAEETLKESKARFQALTETNADFIWETDKCGRYTYCSPQMKNLWGIEPESMLGKTMFELTPEPEKKKYIQQFDAILKTTLSFKNFESISCDSEGKQIYVETCGVPFFDYHGNLEGFRGVTRDVTIKKQQEEKLRNSELKYRSIIETANEGICQLDENLVISYVNESLLKLIGITNEEVTGKHISDFLSNEEFTKIKKRTNEIRKGNRKTFDLRFIRKDHSEITFSVNASTLNDDNGNCTGYVALATDITSRVLMEKDLKRTKKKLQTALKNANIGTWEWNLRSDELVLDRRMEGIFGLKPGTFDRKHTSFENLVHEEDVQYLNEEIKKAIAEGSTFESIYRTRPVGGKCNHILSKATITRDRKGKPVNVSGICFDITEMKEGTEKALIRLNEDLLRSNNDLQQFAYVASHDLQEPLRMVSSFTQLLQQRYADRLDDNANEYISFAVNGSRRMYELLNGLLAYSRIQSRGINLAQVDLNSVVAKVKANIKLLIEETGAVIKCGQLPAIKADESQMIQLMQNLIENAIKFRSGTPEITISSSCKNEMHIISVADNGIGIEPVYYDKIFRIFQRLHHSEYPGTGIGLAICLRIVERHGGKIWVSSKMKEGSVFSFSIPA